MVSDKQLEHISNLYQDKCCVTKLDKAIQSIIKELKEYRAADNKKAKKVILKNYDYSCPICGGIVEAEYKWRFDYCPDCGQKLDWSEIDD